MIQWNWFTPNTILYVKLQGNVTENELQMTDAPLMKAMNTIDAESICLLLDFAELTALPSITKLVKLRWAKYDKLEKLIVVGSREPFSLTASIMAQVFRKDMLFADNLYEARIYLNQLAEHTSTGTL